MMALGQERERTFIGGLLQRASPQAAMVARSAVPSQSRSEHRGSGACRPVSGLTERWRARRVTARRTAVIAFPRREAQWHEDDRFPVYRCGGSAGMAPRERRLHLLPV